MIKNLTKVYEGADLSGAAADVIFLPIVEDGTLEAVDVLTDEATTGDVVFSLKKNGVVQASAAVTVATGAKTGSASSLTIALVKGDEIVLRRVSGSIASPLSLNLNVDDGESILPALAGDVSGFPTETVVEKIQGRLFADTDYADGQVPTWNEALEQFQPGTPAGGGGTTSSSGELSGILAAPKTANAFDDEFEGTALDTAKWLKAVTGSLNFESYNDKIRSAYFFQCAPNGEINLSCDFVPSGDFSITTCFNLETKTGSDNVSLYVVDTDNTSGVYGVAPYKFANAINIQILPASINAWKIVNNVFTNNIGAASFSELNFPQYFLHIQRIGTTFSLWYSNNGVRWYNLTSATMTFTVARLVFAGGANSDSANKVNCAFHWIRRDWITL